MGRTLTLDDVEAAIAGGSVFAAGGGGWGGHRGMVWNAAPNPRPPPPVWV